MNKQPFHDEKSAWQREQPDPMEATHPIPWPMVMVITGIALFGALYFVQFTGDGQTAGGDNRSQPAAPNYTPLPAGGVPPTETGEQNLIDGGKVYTTNCASCHQANGQGVAGAFPPLAKSSWVTENKKTPIRILLLGIQGEIEVSGSQYNGLMPSFGNTLSDAEIAAVLSHIRSSWGNQAEAISETDVQLERQNYTQRKDPWKGGKELLAEAQKP